MVPAFPRSRMRRSAVFRIQGKFEMFRRMARISRLSIMLFLLLAACAAQAHLGAHVHGLVKLGIAVQGATLSIQLESPLDDLLGFEHRPRTPGERQAARALLKQMQSAQGLFRFDTAAQCSLTRSEVESEVLDENKATAASDDHGTESEHADLDASFEFTCRDPTRLTSADIGLFEAFKRIHRIEISIATDKGQFKRELERPQHTLALHR